MQDNVEGIGLFDKTGREIMIGDVVKVFHFIGRRNKHHFMYKQVMRVRIWPSGTKAFYLSHLDMKDDSGNYQVLDGRHLAAYEIVQSIDAKFEDRPRTLLSSEGNGRS